MSFCLCFSQEFIDQFQVLLPKNAKASKEDIFAYLSKLKLDKNNCQIGKTKVSKTLSSKKKHSYTLYSVQLIYNCCFFFCDVYF